MSVTVVFGIAESSGKSHRELLGAVKIPIWVAVAKLVLSKAQ
jgi:hypothetical protein